MTWVGEFVRDGYVRVEGAFPAHLARACREHLWSLTDAAPDDPRTWTSPVVRLGYQDGGPFAEAANTPRLHAAFDTLVGAGRWAPRTDLGTFRHPVPQ